MLKIRPNNVLEFEGQTVKLGGDELPNFLLANLSQEIDIEPGVTVAEIMNITFHVKEFIENYTCEDYYVVNSVYSAMDMSYFKPVSKITARREMVISHENDSINPMFADFSLDESKGATKMFRDLTLELNPVFSVKNHDGEVVIPDLRRNFSFLELIEFVYEELYYTATNTTEDVSPKKTQMPGSLS